MNLKSLLKCQNGASLLLSAVISSSSYANSNKIKVPAPQLPMNTPGFNFKTAANFDDLRHNILELIRGSKKRVWLITDSLTDGGVASALYTAKARNQDVKVFLGRDQINVSGSRLPFLRSQSIPAYLRPKTAYTAPTFLFVDQRLFTFTRDLSPTQRAGGGEVIQASPAEVKAFVSWLKEVMVNPEIAYPRAFRGGRTAKEPFQGDTEGSYNYDRKSDGRKAPEGVVRELPRVPKWKQIEELRSKGQTGTPPAPNETAPDSPQPKDESKSEPSSAPEVEGARTIEGAPGTPPNPAVKPWVEPSVAPAPEAPKPASGEAAQPTPTSP